MAIHDIMSEMIAYFSGEPGRTGHALKVLGYACGIAGGEGVEPAKQTVIEAAAILHDIGIPESIRLHGSDAGHLQEKYGPPIARDILSRVGGYDQAFIDDVCRLVGTHHSYGVDADICLRILFEADFLVNLEEKNLPREQAPNIREKHFRTATGKQYLDHLFFTQTPPAARGGDISTFFDRR